MNFPLTHIHSYIGSSLLNHRLVISNVTNERDCALQQLAECVANRDSELKQAAKSARLQERDHYSSKVDHYKHKSTAQASQITSLTNRTIDAEIQQKKSERQVQQSTRRSQNAMEYTESLLQKIKILEKSNQDLHNIAMLISKCKWKRKQRELRLMDAAVPIKVLARERYGSLAEMDMTGLLVQWARHWMHFTAHV